MLSCYEMHTSRAFMQGKDSVDGQLEYVVHGTNDDAAVRAKIEAEAPAQHPTKPGLVRDRIRTRTIGGLMWYATVEYIPDGSPLYPAVGLPGPRPIPPTSPGEFTPLGPDFAFDLTAQTERITQSKQTLSKTKRGGGIAPDTKGAIGITADGKVEGCDRIKPYLEWSTTKTFDYITMAYLDTLSSLVGTTNKEVFYSHAIGTTIFLGASGNSRDLSKAVVTFKFAKQHHRENIEICTGLTVPSKPAWAYLWVSYKDVDDEMKLTQQPDAAYVERIYDEGEYVRMGIG